MRRPFGLLALMTFMVWACSEAPEESANPTGPKGSKLGLRGAGGIGLTGGVDVGTSGSSSSSGGTGAGPTGGDTGDDTAGGESGTTGGFTCVQNSACTPSGTSNKGICKSNFCATCASTPECQTAYPGQNLVCGTGGYCETATRTCGAVGAKCTMPNSLRGLCSIADTCGSCANNTECANSWGAEAPACHNGSCKVCQPNVACIRNGNELSVCNSEGSTCACSADSQCATLYSGTGQTKCSSGQCVTPPSTTGGSTTTSGTTTTTGGNTTTTTGGNTTTSGTTTTTGGNTTTTTGGNTTTSGTTTTTGGNTTTSGTATAGDAGTDDDGGEDGGDGGAGGVTQDGGADDDGGVSEGGGGSLAVLALQAIIGIATSGAVAGCNVTQAGGPTDGQILAVVVGAAFVALGRRRRRTDDADTRDDDDV